LAETRCAACDQVLNGSGAVGSALPASLVAASRLEDASLVLLAFAYLTGCLALATGLAPLVALHLALEWKVVAALAGTLAGAVLFVTLKYASEALRALADVARSACRVEQRLDQALRAPIASAPRQDTGRPGLPAPGATP
jgi:hypothetical protein